MEIRYFPIISVTLFTLVAVLFTGCASLSGQMESLEAQYRVDGSEADRGPAGIAHAQSEEQRLEERAYYQRARQARELVLGMTMNDVKSLWGEPGSVDVAGDPRNENERWVYFNGLSSRWSMSSSRIIYFEGGQVVGWKTGQQ